MADITGLEIARPGEWELSTGPLTVTPAMLTAAVTNAAAAGDGFRAPVKLGHTDPRFDGEPALGWLHNLRVEGTGPDSVLLADVTGMPDWLAALGPSAYPDRSVEGWANVEEDGFEVTALALLGVTPPGMSTIRSLRDIPQALGVAAAGPVLVAATFTATRDTVAAAASVSDRAWSSFTEASYTIEQWRRACLIKPAVGPSDSKADYKLPVREPDGAVNRNAVHAAAGRLGQVQGVSAEAKKAAAAALVGLYRNVLQESPPPALLAAAGQTAASDGTSTPAPHGDGSTETQEGSPAVPFTDDQLTIARQRLGLPADADETAVMAALTAPPDTAAVSATRWDPDGDGDDDSTPEGDTDHSHWDKNGKQLKSVPGKPLPGHAAAAEPLPIAAKSGVTTTIDTAVLEAIQAQARKGEQAYAAMEATERDRTIEAAVADGKIPRARVDHWTKYWRSDPDGAKAALASMPKGLVPIAATGYTGGVDEEFNEEYSALFPTTGTAG